jgi:hypothetical protein
MVRTLFPSCRIYAAPHDMSIDSVGGDDGSERAKAGSWGVTWNSLLSLNSTSHTARCHLDYEGDILALYEVAIWVKWLLVRSTTSISIMKAF